MTTNFDVNNPVNYKACRLKQYDVHVCMPSKGCGAFRGDARIVGKVFADALKEFKNFDLVVFSIKSTKNDYKDNFELFRGGFYNAD